MSIPDGIINLLKPPGISSFKAVHSVKKIINIRKAGHTGTLDPTAAGVLPICTGKATRVIPYLDDDIKEYLAELTLGITTDTLDREGNIIKNNDDWRALDRDEILDVIYDFQGIIEQIPPMFSAVHHKGQRLYKLAREGKKVEREARRIEIFSLNVIDVDLPVIRFRVMCSRGTYIRSLVRDIGEKLDTGAYLSFLLRTRSGPFSISKSWTFTEIEDLTASSNYDFISSPDKNIDKPAVIIKKEAYKKAVNGAYLFQEDLESELKRYDKGQIVLVYDFEDDFISISKIEEEEGRYFCKPERVFK